MIRSIKNKWLICLALFVSCRSSGGKKETMPFINKPDFTPEWISQKDPAYKRIHTIPPFSFIDQDGKTITEKTVEGKVYVADFFFTHCGSICPVMTRNMGKLQSLFRNNDKVLFLSHSVLPEMDSVPILKRYADARGIIGEKWHLLTGDKEKIYSIARQQYFAGDTIGYYQTGNEFLHTENFILVDQNRRIRGVYNGTLELEMDRLKEDIETLLKDEQ